MLGRDRIEHRDRGYLLRCDWLDAAELALLTDEVERRRGAGNVVGAAAAARVALSLLRGATPGPVPGEWAQLRASAGLERLASRGRLAAATALLKAGDWVAAADAAAVALERDPYEEAALRVLLRAYVMGGQAAAALAAYASARERLADELGTDPSPETTALYTAILRGEVAGPAPLPASAAMGEFSMSANHVSGLKFGDDIIAIAPEDTVVLAVPPRPAASLLPGLKTPNKYRAIVNAHFRFDPPPNAPLFLGVVGGLVEWLFAFPQRLSVTISNADRLVDMPREELAQAIWQDVCKAAGVAGELPPWQIVRERRATFEATPEQNSLRPGPSTSWNNLFLAGDWTDTGLPATIEGSVRSGDRAADLVLARR